MNWLECALTIAGVVVIVAVAVGMGAFLGLLAQCIFADEDQALIWLRESEKPPAVRVPHWRCTRCGMMLHADYAKLGEPIVCGSNFRPPAPCPMEYVDENGKVLT